MMRRVVAVVAALLVLGSTACTGGGEPGRVAPAGAGATPVPTAPPVTLAVTPDPGSRDAPLSTEIGTRVTDGTVSEVVLASEEGDTITGGLRADGTAWVPDAPLEPTTTYTATVTAKGAGDRVATAETTFTTMDTPSLRTDTGMYLSDGQEYGVGMPVVVEFFQPVPEEYRAGVERRMFVTTDPPQPGVWHWVGGGRQAFYRAQDFWQPGTTLGVRIALSGHPTGDGRYGDTDRRATVTVGDASRIEIDNATKELSFYSGEELVRRMPVSLGKPSTPTSSGNMVIMTKERNTVFDTFDELGPGAGYRVAVEYAMRLTWGGEFIHAAPWSVADQGVRNVSHGCINLSTDNAGWLFERAKVGDPVIIKGTEAELEHGNGWTAWDLSWEEFAAGSALADPDPPD